MEICRTGNQLLIVGTEYFRLSDLALCLTFGAQLSDPGWQPCDSFVTGLQRAKAEGLAKTETFESEIRSATGFRDVTWGRHEAVRRRTTERPAAQ